MRHPHLAFASICLFIGISLLGHELFILHSKVEPVIAENVSGTVLGSTTKQSPPSLTPTVTVIPTATSIPTPLPTNTPTPLPESTVATKENTSANPTAPDTKSLLQQVNDYRQSHGLSLVTENTETCAFAQLRVAEISTSFNHDGFRERMDSKTLPYPSYSEVTENIAMNSDRNRVVPNWINSAGHAENMRKDTPYVCIRSLGDFHVYVGWKP